MRISTYPTEFRNNINVEIVSDVEEHCIISLTNQKGMIRVLMGVHLRAGVNNILVDNIGALEVGAYHLHVKNTESKTLYDAQLIKQ